MIDYLVPFDASNSKGLIYYLEMNYPKSVPASHISLPTNKGITHPFFRNVPNVHIEFSLGTDRAPQNMFRSIKAFRKDCARPVRNDPARRAQIPPVLLPLVGASKSIVISVA